MKVSLRTRIAVLSVLAAALALAGFAWAALGAVHTQQIAAVDTEIESLATRLAGRGQGRGGKSGQRPERFFEFLLEDISAQVWIRGSKDTEVYRSPDWAFDEEPASVESAAQTVGGPAWHVHDLRFFTRQLPSGSWRVGEFLGRDITLMVALPLAGVEAARNELAMRFLFLALPALAFTCAAVWWIAWRSLRPLQEIKSTAARIVAGDWNRRISPASRAPEISQLVASLNQMLDCLAAAREQAGRFTSDASHELQTPLAVMQAALEDALAHAPADSREESLCLDLTEELARMKSIMANLLLLARADAGKIDIQASEIDLCQELREVFEEMSATYPELKCEVEGPPSLIISADPALLRIILRNLVGNAAKFSPKGEAVRVSISKNHEEVSLTIANRGSAIPCDEREKIFERFGRADGDAQRLPGQGLGLALARECARILGFKVELIEECEGWVCFRILGCAPCR